MKNFAEHIENRLQNEKNRELLLRYIEHNLALGKSRSRIIAYIGALVPLSNWVGKPFKKMKKSDMEKYMKHLLGRDDYSDWTKYTQQVIIKNCFFPWSQTQKQGPCCPGERAAGEGALP